MKNHFNEILLRDKIYFFRKRKKRYFQFYQLSIRMVFFFETKNILFISLLFIYKQVKKHDFLVRVYITHIYIYIYRQVEVHSPTQILEIMINLVLYLHFSSL